MLFRFEPFALDAETRQLVRDGEAVHISPKAFELLKVLVEARPRALAKAELHERLWPDTFVSDANLAILINEIRGALDDDARAPRFIRTVHGFGYAFRGQPVDFASPEPGQNLRSVSFWLIWRAEKFALPEGTNLVGRSPEAAIWVDLPGVSREHARVTIRGQSATIEDLGSTNGTFLDGTRITLPVVLRDGNQILFGSVPMTFRQWTPGAGTKTQDLSETAPPAS